MENRKWKICRMIVKKVEGYVERVIGWKEEVSNVF